MCICICLALGIRTCSLVCICTHKCICDYVLMYILIDCIYTSPQQFLKASNNNSSSERLVLEYAHVRWIFADTQNPKFVFWTEN